MSNSQTINDLTYFLEGFVPIFPRDSTKFYGENWVLSGNPNTIRTDDSKAIRLNYDYLYDSTKNQHALKPFTGHMIALNADVAVSDYMDNRRSTMIHSLTSLDTSFRTGPVQNPALRLQQKLIRESIVYGITKPIQEQFNLQIEKQSLESDKKAACRTYFVRTLSLFEKIEPTRIVFSFTGDNSLYFRFYKDDIRVHLEVFFVKEDEDDNIEGVYTVYKKDVILSKEFGELDKVFQKIQSVVKPDSIKRGISQNVITNDALLSY